MESSKQKQFEEALRKKLELKSGGSLSEETVLMRAFKYFDLDGSGACSPEEFKKAMEKIGVAIGDDKDIMQIFNLYDINRNGSLEYKEFASILYKKGGEAKQEKNAEALLKKLRDKLKTRGASGIIGLGRNFRIMDDDRSGMLDINEFTKAMNDFGLGFSKNEIGQLYEIFDVNKDGTIEYDEFLRHIRGPMNERRKQLVRQAFKKLDKDGSGIVDINDIKGVYSAKKHPDVASGKRTEDEVLQEFLQTFEIHHNTASGVSSDFSITPDEFQEYYSNVSASIDNDQYFELMMTNAWKLGDSSYAKGWADGQAGSLAFRRLPPKEQHYPSELMQPASQAIGKSSPGKKAGIQYTVGDRPVDLIVDKFRQRLIARGARGFIGLQRQFKIMDDDHSHSLDKAEFKKAMKDFRVEISDMETDMLFQEFDKDGSGAVDYDEFVRGIRGPMNGFRKALSMKAFNIMDKDKSGVLDISDIKGVYSAKFHPDVKSGKRTEDDILGEFLETFETHHAVRFGGQKDQTVTKEEWEEYYNNISASIDTDEYFELMMNSAWNLDGSRVTKKGWGSEI